MSYNPDEPPETVQEELDATIAELARTREELGRANGWKMAYKNERAALLGTMDQVQKLAAERDALRAALAKTREELAKVTRERDDLHALNGQRVHERDTLRAELAAEQAKNTELQHEINRINAR